VLHLPKQQNIGIEAAKNAVLPLLLDEFLQIEYVVVGRYFDLENYMIAFQKAEEHTNGGNLRIWIMRPQSAVEVDESENETNLQMGFYQQCSATTSH